LLDIIHRLVWYLKRNVSETGFCVRLQVNAYSVPRLLCIIIITARKPNV
jgi:hypothetical protein